MYGSVSLGMGNTIYSIDVRVITATYCPTNGPWFGEFMRGSNIRIVVIRRQDFGITCKMLKDLLERWWEERK